MSYKPRELAAILQGTWHQGAPAGLPFRGEQRSSQPAFAHHPATGQTGGKAQSQKCPSWRDDQKRLLPEKKQKALSPFRAPDPALLWGCTGTSMPQGCFGEEIFLPQLDLSTFSKCQLAPSGPKLPTPWWRHGRKEREPGGTARTDSAGPKHPLPQHPASCSRERSPGQG